MVIFQYNGKCTIEPKWIRWHKNHKRVECAHPDCTHKSNVDYTYPGLMKHIIEYHTVQEDSVSITWTFSIVLILTFLPIQLLMHFLDHSVSWLSIEVSTKSSFKISPRNGTSSSCQNMPSLRKSCPWYAKTSADTHWWETISVW